MFADQHGTRFTLMLTLFVQGTLVMWLINAQDPVIFFLYALLWGFGYGGVGTQYGIVAREVYGRAEERFDSARELAHETTARANVLSNAVTWRVDPKLALLTLQVSGCLGTLLGFESLNQQSLRSMRKAPNLMQRRAKGAERQSLRSRECRWRGGDTVPVFPA